MRTVNIKSLVELYIKNNKMLPNGFLKYIGKDYNVDVKEEELIPLVKLINKIETSGIVIDMNCYNNFYLGYEIPQIGKEFDLLKIMDNLIINIEYKREIENEMKIKKQLVKNKHYLKFLEREIILIGYSAREDRIYQLEDDNLCEINTEKLVEILSTKGKNDYTDLNVLFKVSNYLISPFNKCENFMKDEYFLTDHQEKINNNISDAIKDGKKIFLIQGGAGTGKTLLTYHLCKKLTREEKKVAIIHCGALNQGQLLLNEKYNWNVFSVKHYGMVTNKDFDVIIIDEIQRINARQFKDLLNNYILPKQKILIASGDKKQILGNSEGEIIQDLENSSAEKYSLTKKIRTNKELSNFINVMIDLKKFQSNPSINSDKISIVYFDSYDEANNYISTKKDYSFISYTPSVYLRNGLAGFEITCDNINTVGNSHRVIGQEFENVGVIIDCHFYYDDRGVLRARYMNNNVYPPRDMLYQAVTRVIDTLEVIVVDNIDVFNKLISILSFDN